MDGCSAWGLFWRVSLPLVRPALATVVVFNALTLWNEFAFALTLIRDDPAGYTLPLALVRFRGEHATEMARTCAALCVAVLPMLAVYALAQRHIIRGLTAGAVRE
jgi:raffinose/stachyose/melibiose transport system permease protein